MCAICRRKISGRTAANIAAADSPFAPAQEHLASPLELLTRSQTISRRQRMKGADSAGLCKDRVDLGVRHTGGCAGLKILSRMCLFGLTVFFCVGTLALAQAARFKARLSPIAMDASMLATVAGSGSVSAHLTGSKLVINGSFEGLLSPATTAQVRQSAVTGVVGPVIFELTITHATSGAMTGSIDLTPEQAQALHQGRLYVQVNSEKAPAGNLWGWLLS